MGGQVVHGLRKLGRASCVRAIVLGASPANVAAAEALPGTIPWSTVVLEDDVS